MDTRQRYPPDGGLVAARPGHPDEHHAPTGKKQKERVGEMASSRREIHSILSTLTISGREIHSILSKLMISCPEPCT